MMFFVVLYVLLWCFDFYVFSDFVLPFLYYINFYDFSLCSFIIASDFSLLLILTFLNLVHVLLFFNFDLFNCVFSIFYITYLFVSNKFFFNVHQFVCMLISISFLWLIFLISFLLLVCVHQFICIHHFGYFHAFHLSRLFWIVHWFVMFRCFIFQFTHITITLF